MRQSVISRSSSILISRSSGPVQSGCRQALRWSIPGGRARISATRGASLWPRRIPPAAGLGPLADDDLDRVGAAQVVGVHAVARGQQLEDQLVGVLALLRRHAAV